MSSSEQPTVDSERSPDSADGASAGDGPRSRSVAVPMRIYKAVTVFSTLFAVFGVVGGFVILDTATNRATADLEEISLPLALLGLGLIVGASAMYAFSTRFEAEEMRKPKERSDEGSGNG